MNEKELAKLEVDIVVDILQFAKEHLLKGFSDSELTDYLKSKHPELDAKFLVFQYTKKYYIRDPKTDKLTIGPEGYFAYLQYLDMQNAIKSQEISMAAAQKSIGLSEESIKLAQESLKRAKQSNRNAIMAIVVSIVLGVISLIFGIRSQYDDRTIDVKDTQIKELIQVTEEVKKSNENMINVLEIISFDIKQTLAEKDSISRHSKPKNN